MANTATTNKNIIINNIAITTLELSPELTPSLYLLSQFSWFDNKNTIVSTKLTKLGIPVQHNSK